MRMLRAILPRRFNSQFITARHVKMINLMVGHHCRSVCAPFLSAHTSSPLSPSFSPFFSLSTHAHMRTHKSIKRM